MINISLTALQLVLVVFVAVIAYLLGQQTVKILVKIIFTSKPVMGWNLRRQLEQKKVTKLSELQQMENNVGSLTNFMDWIDKNLQGVDKKSFWRDFGSSKETRAYWVKTLKEIIGREKAQLNAPIVAPKPVIKTVEK